MSPFLDLQPDDLQPNEARYFRSPVNVGAVHGTHLAISAVPAGCGSILPSGAAFLVR